MAKVYDMPHRLALPIETRYLGADERLRDPAHVLESLLRDGGAAGQSEQGKHGRCLARFARLVAWADEQRGSLDLDPEEFARPEFAGGEHAVFLDRDTGRLVKITKPGMLGAQAEDAGAYLERWALANRVFGDDVRFEGVVRMPGEDEPRVVISQSFVEGSDATMEEQADYLRSRGFVEYDGRWVHPVLAVAVWDTLTPGNVIVQPDGAMWAVDLQIEPARAEELRAVQGRRVFGF